MGLWTLSIDRKSKITTFRNLDILPSSGEDGGSRSSFRNVVILDSRTMDKVQKPISSQFITIYKYPGICQHFSSIFWHFDIWHLKTEISPVSTRSAQHQLAPQQNTHEVTLGHLLTSNRCVTFRWPPRIALATHVLAGVPYNVRSHKDIHCQPIRSRNMTHALRSIWRTAISISLSSEQVSQTTHCIAKFDSHHSKFRGIPNGGFVSCPSTCTELTGPPLTINKVIVHFAMILSFCTTGLEHQFLPERPCLPPTCSAVSLFCVHISPGPPRAGTGPPARADRLKIKTHATYSGPLPDYPAPVICTGPLTKHMQHTRAPFRTAGPR
jgi:hypothetical protein